MHSSSSFAKKNYSDSYNMVMLKKTADFSGKENIQSNDFSSKLDDCAIFDLSSYSASVSAIAFDGNSLTFAL